MIVSADGVGWHGRNVYASRDVTGLDCRKQTKNFKVAGTGKDASQVVCVVDLTRFDPNERSRFVRLQVAGLDERASE
jgi:hypothetical protein